MNCCRKCRDPNHMWGTSIANIRSFIMFFRIPPKLSVESQNIFEILISSILSSFELRLRVSLAGNGYLTMISRVRNVNSKPFSFSFAYHTYYSVSDIRSVTKCDHHNIHLTSRIRMLNKRWSEFYIVVIFYHLQHLNKAR